MDACNYEKLEGQHAWKSGYPAFDGRICVCCKVHQHGRYIYGNLHQIEKDGSTTTLHSGEFIPLSPPFKKKES